MVSFTKWVHSTVLAVSLGSALPDALPAQQTLHPALTPDEAALAKVWKTGFERAKRDKNPDRTHKLAKRGIGSIKNKTVSWVMFEHPRFRAFELGFRARTHMMYAGKTNLTQEEEANSQKELRLLVEEGTKTLRFHVELGIYPRLEDEIGVIREANSEDAQNVSAYLSVGDRTYQPVQQPDNNPARRETGEYFWTEKTPIGTREISNGDGTTFTVTDYSYNYPSVKYTYYTKEFDLIFNLRNEDGTPRLTEKDTEITVFVKGGFGTQKATYRLKDWLNAFEK